MIDLASTAEARADEIWTMHGINIPCHDWPALKTVELTKTLVSISDSNKYTKCRDETHPRNPLRIDILMYLR